MLLSVSDGVCESGEAWSAGGDIAVARAARIAADPELVERAILDAEPESHWTIGDCGQVGRAVPHDASAGAVPANRHAGRARVRRDGVALLVEDFHAHLAGGSGEVHEQMLSAE